MATERQIHANRNNAKKSTGPRTGEGKARSSQNALKHGLLARDAVLPGEDPAEFDQQLAALEADIRPANSLEFELVRQIADAQWRMRRLSRLETGLLAAEVDTTRRFKKRCKPETLQPGHVGETLLLGSAMVQRTQALVHLARYDGHLSRRFHQAIKQLAALRDAAEKRRRSAAPGDRPVPPAPPDACGDPRPYNPSRAQANGGGSPPRQRTASPCTARGSRFTKTAKQSQSRPTHLQSVTYQQRPGRGAKVCRPSAALRSQLGPQMQQRFATQGSRPLAESSNRRRPSAALPGGSKINSNSPR